MRYLSTLLLLTAPALLLADDAPTAPAKKTERTAEQKAAIEQIRKAGGQVIEIAQNDARLDIAFHLADGDITDDHLAPLAKLSQVYAINLRGTKVTDAGLKHLSHLKALTKLHLEKTSIGDSGLAQLKGLESLEYLNLYATPVTDAGLANLNGLKSLKRVYLWQTKVTDAGVNTLQKALPDLEINRGLALTPAPKPEAEEKPDPAKKK